MTTVSFVHANGFPAGSYRKLFAHWPAEFNVLALEKFGHNPHFPISNNWPALVDELLQFLDQSSEQPVIAVGHSFGAILSYLAVRREPERFRGLIMLDPPIITGMARWAIKFAKHTALIDKITPAQTAVRRRRHWSKDANIVASFAKRSFFRNFDPDCLQDYVAAVTHQEADRHVLNFLPEVEAAIFRTLPDNLSVNQQPLTIPSALIYGPDSTVCQARFYRPFAKQNKMSLIAAEAGGHMFPLEFPIATANQISTIIKSWSTAHSTAS